MGSADAATLPRRPTPWSSARASRPGRRHRLGRARVTVDVIERQPYLGGRVGGWTETLQGGTPVAMNRGFHAFFRQYYNLRNLLRRIDHGLSMLQPLADYPLVDAHGRRDTFRGLPKTPPFNALVFALRSPTFRLRDLARLNARAAAPLAAVSVPEIYRLLDHLDALTFLREINFPTPHSIWLSRCSPAASSPNPPSCQPPNWPPCFTFTSWVPARASSSMWSTPISMRRCGIRCVAIWKTAVCVSTPGCR
ncbi:flavin containing amine oxidoreductase family protein [Mycobacterium xenopi 3993]|nr:flavin containing amine oxidoreductase family protein [Mycobacterium xenopi 3993]